MNEDCNLPDGESLTEDMSLVYDSPEFRAFDRENYRLKRDYFKKAKVKKLPGRRMKGEFRGLA